MKKAFKDKVVWISGASSGIGAALAKEFVDKGAIVALSARRKERLAMLKNNLGDRAYVFPLDVQLKKEVKKAANDIVKTLGKIDIVIANAGYAVMAPFENISEEMWRRQFEVNFFGAIWMIKSALPYVAKTKGNVALISSVMANFSLNKASAYGASKAALTSLGNSLYLELHSKGITLTTISPGLIKSEIHLVDNLGNIKNPNKKLSHKKLRLPAHRAARSILKAIYKGKREVVITGHGKFVSFLFRHCPNAMYGLLKRLRFGARH